MRLLILAGTIFALLAGSAQAQRVSYVAMPKGHEPKSLTLGPDGKVWYVSARNRSQDPYRFTPLILGRVAPDGDVQSTRAPMPINGGATLERTLDGAMIVGWTSWNRQGRTRTYIASGGMGRITTTGAFTDLTLFENVSGPSLQQRREDLLMAPDGSTWYTQSHEIGRLQTTAAGLTNTAAPVPGGRWMDTFELALAADGGVWYAGERRGQGTVGRVSPAAYGSDLVFEEVHSQRGRVSFLSPTTGPDQALWFLSYTRRRGRIALVRLDLATRAVRVMNDDLSGLPDLVLGPDGNFWTAGQHALERITPAGRLTRFRLGKNVQPTGLVVGGDRRLWFADHGRKRSHLGRFTVPGARG